jgi:hypothetical protein
MNIPTLIGTIRRRILVNFRADPEVIKSLLPQGFRPKLQDGHAVAGICLIRLENIRPKFVPSLAGIHSENAAHRIAVEWDENDEVKEGVFIPRRDTDSGLNAIAGGRLFPGEHNRADFEITETEQSIDFLMKSRDGRIEVDCVDHSPMPCRKVRCFLPSTKHRISSSGDRLATRLDAVVENWTA